MKLNVAETYEEMARKAAGDLLALLQTLEQPLICPASGNTPVAVYRHLLQLIETSQVDTSNWYFVALDEWQGMNGKDEGSCRHMLDQYLFFPLGIKEENICFFDGRAADLQNECERVETFIAKKGGITVALLGIGLNGHIGMNEPGTPLSSRSHIAHLHPSTQQVGQKYFTKPHQLHTGVTLGMATILEARHLYLIANGEHKATIMQKMLSFESTAELPATWLKHHADLRIFLDKEAASLIR